MYVLQYKFTCGTLFYKNKRQFLHNNDIIEFLLKDFDIPIGIFSKQIEINKVYKLPLQYHALIGEFKFKISDSL